VLIDSREVVVGTDFVRRDTGVKGQVENDEPDLWRDIFGVGHGCLSLVEGEGRSLYGRVQIRL